MATNLPDRVQQFVCHFWYESPHRLRADTRLEEDLRMTGTTRLSSWRHSPRRSRLT
jgi:hypothetical protein